MRWPPPEITPLRSPAGDETWERFRQAAIDLAIERGYWGFEVDDIVGRAGASRAEFDARFSGRADCCDRAYEANIADFDHALVDPFLAAPSWREGIRAAAYGAAGYLRGGRRERRYGELRMLEGGPMEQAMKDRYLQRIVDLVDVGRCELRDPDAVNRRTAEAAVGSVYGLVLRRLKESEGQSAGESIIDEAVYLIERFYVEDEANIEALAAI